MKREEQIRMWEEAAGVKPDGNADFGPYKNPKPKRPGGPGPGFKPFSAKREIPTDPKTGKHLQ